jgi:hypothetical protein
MEAPMDDQSLNALEPVTPTCEPATKAVFSESSLGNSDRLKCEETGKAQASLQVQGACLSFREQQSTLRIPQYCPI